MNEFQRINENKYYLKDLYVFLVSLFVSILFSEVFLIHTDYEFYNKLFIYIMVFFPTFTLALILSYFYRNYRIKQTGRIWSIIRYRLTIAFLFISILPSIPLLLFSSNIGGKLVENFYQIQIQEALSSAKNNILNLEEEDKKNLLFKAKILQKNLGKNLNQINLIYAKSLDIGLLQSNKFYLGIYKENKNVYENFKFQDELKNLEFKKLNGENIEEFSFYQTERAFYFLKLNSNNEKNYLILGRRIHIGNEKNIYNILFTERNYSNIVIWKDKLPTAFRVLIGIFFIITFIISILISLILARQISRPIVQLAEATQQVSKGEMDVKIDLVEDGEMGILIESFNQLTKDLKSKNEELIHIQRIAAWKEVAQRMAHEIKNPLTPIQLSAERIRKKLDNPNKDKFEEVIKNGTETIIGQVRVLEHLVKEFSEFARMPSPILINQHINPIIEESVKLFIDHVNIDFTLKLSKNLPEVFLDKRLFLGVVNNLIKNAVEAIHNFEKENIDQENFKSYKGNIRISTKLEKTLLRKSLILSIEDNGPGIETTMKEKIFQPYFSTKEGHGTGIGLAIVEKTVLDHNSHLRLLDSELGGCLFRIEIPVEGKK